MKDGSWSNISKEVLLNCLSACQKFIACRMLLMGSLTIIDCLASYFQIFNLEFVSKMNLYLRNSFNRIRLKNDGNCRFNDFQKNVHLPILILKLKIPSMQ